MRQFKNISFLGVLMVLPFTSFCQEPDDTTKTVKPEVVTKEMIQQMPRRDSVSPIAVKHIAPIRIQHVHAIRILRNSDPALDKEAIEALAPDDAGELMAKLTGTTVKSYGGLGGLKSVSIRALGSQHTAMVVDGFNITNSQSGQVNLGQIQTDGLMGVQATSSGGSGVMVPVSAEIASSALRLSTFQSALGRRPNLSRINLRYGSFDRFDGYASGRFTIKNKLMISGYGKYRRSDGDYKYQFQNGLNQEDGVRRNNDYEDAYLGGQLLFFGKKQRYYRIGYNTSFIDQGLPGAVILYNETADERLNTFDANVYADALLPLKKAWLMRPYGSASRNRLSYEDPTYPNAEGFINTDYLNQKVNFGTVFAKWDYNKINYRGGIEENFSTLVSSDSSLSNPMRSHLSAFFSAEKYWGWMRLKVQGSAQYINEFLRTGEASNDVLKVNPFVYISTQERRNWRYTQNLWYKNTFRMPSFNELYYNYVGNSDLKPESAHQINYGLSFIPKEGRKRDIYVRTNVYYNRVENKIVAIPTKNLFVWSMQNVTNVNVYGAEAAIDVKWNFGSYDVNVMANYSYQKAIDVTEGSLNYGDQIAYTPEHMANFDLGVTKGKLSFRVANNFVAGRFALNENIDQNLVEGYLITDVMVNYWFDLKKDRKIRVQANLKNAFDQSYAYVRSFVMPGRNFLISLSYALH